LQDNSTIGAKLAINFEQLMIKCAIFFFGVNEVNDATVDQAFVFQPLAEGH
jgi:hypothetical protein